MVETAHNTLKAALRKAVAWRLLTETPMENVERPPRPRPKRQAWTPEQAQRFMDTVKDHRLHALYLIFLVTGLRRGEVLGLKWKHVDLEAHTINVQETLIFPNGKRTAKATPKSSAGERRFAVPLEIVEALKVRRGQQLIEQATAQQGWTDLGYVFTAHNGQGLYDSVLRRIHDKLIVLAGVPRLTLHELRHTYASLARRAGIDIKEISRRLGHSSVVITMDTYQHLYQDQQENSALSSADLFAPTPVKISAGVTAGSNENSSSG